MKFSIFKENQKRKQREHKNVIKIAVIRCIAAWIIIEAYDQKKEEEEIQIIFRFIIDGMVR
jgi:hypothetical protein